MGEVMVAKTHRNEHLEQAMALADAVPALMLLA